jgi:hypothetical protein
MVEVKGRLSHGWLARLVAFRKQAQAISGLALQPVWRTTQKRMLLGCETRNRFRHREGG